MGAGRHPPGRRQGLCPRPNDRAYLLVPAGAQGPGFLMLPNFRVIMKYNPSEAYAMAIGHLADRLRGGGPFVQPWPRHERVLTRAERNELQQLLAQHGYDVGEPDGRLGRQNPGGAAAVSGRQGAWFPTASPRRPFWTIYVAASTEPPPPLPASVGPEITGNRAFG